MAVDIKKIPLTDINLDQNNVRFGFDTAESQREALSLLMESDTDANKIYNLATHIAENGLNPAEVELVIFENDKCIVVEGNRRLAAVKLLKTPDLCPFPKLTSKFKKLSQEVKSDDLDAINCAVIDSREESDKWIELLHTGENNGAGRVQWSGDVRDQYRERRGGKPTIGRQIRTLINESDLFEQDAKTAVNKIPVTTLTRLFGSKPAQDKFKYSIQGGELKLQVDISDLAPSLQYAILYFDTNRMTTDNVYTSADRENFLNNIPEDLTPSSSRGVQSQNETANTQKKNNSNSSSNQANRVPNTSKKPKPSVRPKPDDLNRKYLINYPLTIDNSKVNLVYIALRREMAVDTLPVPVGIVFRVFLELSCDHYLNRYESTQNPVKHPNKPNDTLKIIQQPSLSLKVVAIANHLENEGKLRKGEATAIRRQASTQDSIGSIDHLNEFVHGSTTSTMPRELNQIANNYEVFLKKVWS